MTDLSHQHCITPAEGLQALDTKQAETLLSQVDDWELDVDSGSLQREFSFDNFYQTIAFVNALAWIANREDHHPDLEVGYKRCLVRYTTHAVGGLSQNDFICAARIDALHR
ncbi:MAG: 4a-hydroxytetrahydrobiopterin dehydratase [Gammaproteobacteria bacterium]|nr:4a-hydroxytetrahydrobiopterin dehydratase [Gammaproteobacteria bacterium]MCW8841661.1 4a-hydroxytetrahydrobiopterin dehydratase [Gammaproteobacteria bacterium]MCW8928230.1 4a-hydroxytetrahydrobiopterin dehydratase [Gammaproteobacteria bacterium]MCW8957436.1 4a-hydroxytetrahydrobiopterin dehydratase [Gammaproteobacteria bacterium]MCW8974041.1 4a-hydroxytetrahydrobiopterin dehydratase [Gammaproteobacteria bacterium]